MAPKQRQLDALVAFTKFIKLLRGLAVYLDFNK